MPQGYEQNKGRRIRKGLVASMSAFAMLLTSCSSAEKATPNATASQTPEGGADTGNSPDAFDVNDPTIKGVLEAISTGDVDMLETVCTIPADDPDVQTAEGLAKRIISITNGAYNPYYKNTSPATLDDAKNEAAAARSNADLCLTFLDGQFGSGVISVPIIFETSSGNMWRNYYSSQGGEAAKIAKATELYWAKWDVTSAEFQDDTLVVEAEALTNYPRSYGPEVDNMVNADESDRDVFGKQGTVTLRFRTTNVDGVISVSQPEVIPNN